MRGESVPPNGELIFSFSNWHLLTPQCRQTFVDAYRYEGFLTAALQTDVLSPRLTVIADVGGIFAFAPTFTYRVTDDLCSPRPISPSRAAGRQAPTYSGARHPPVPVDCAA